MKTPRVKKGGKPYTPAPAKPVTPHAQKIVDLTFELFMAAHDDPRWFVASSRDEIANWVAQRLGENGAPTEPLGMSWGVLQTQDPSPVPEAILDSWDRLSGAIGDVLTAQPFRMTEASDRLEQTRREHHDLIYRLGLNR